MGSKNSAVTEDDFCRKDEFKWFEMEKRIKGIVKRVSISNVNFTADEICKQENLLAGRGVFCREVMKSQKRFPKLSNVYAALVAIINSKFPDVGLLLVKRVVLQFKQDYESKNKKQMQGTTMFLAHLVNQMVVYEVAAFEVLLRLLGNPSSDNVEVAVNFCIECGSSLMDFDRCKLDEILAEYKRLLQCRKVEKRVKVMTLRLLAARKAKFWEHPGIIDDLDVVEVGGQVTHHVSMLHDIYPENSVDSFRANLELDDDDEYEISSH